MTNPARSSLSVAALLELHTAHRGVDALFDHLTSHVADLDATVQHLQAKLTEKQQRIDELEAQLQQEHARQALALHRAKDRAARKWWQLW